MAFAGEVQILSSAIRNVEAGEAQVAGNRGQSIFDDDGNALDASLQATHQVLAGPQLELMSEQRLKNSTTQFQNQALIQGLSYGGAESVGARLDPAQMAHMENQNLFSRAKR